MTVSPAQANGAITDHDTIPADQPGSEEKGHTLLSRCRRRLAPFRFASPLKFGIALFAFGACANFQVQAAGNKNSHKIDLRSVEQGADSMLISGSELKRILLSHRMYLLITPVTVSDRFFPDGTWTRSSVGGVVSTNRKGRYSIDRHGVVSITPDPIAPSPYSAEVVKALTRSFRLYKNKKGAFFTKDVGTSEITTVVLEK